MFVNYSVIKQTLDSVFQFVPLNINIFKNLLFFKCVFSPFYLFFKRSLSCLGPEVDLL